jgi:hypothetical protein
MEARKNKMNKIIILWATIRPQMFLDVLKIWKENKSNNNNIEIYVQCKDQSQADEISKKQYIVDHIFIGNIGLPASLTYLCNKIEETDNAIIINIQDDLYPPPHWDKIISDEFKNYSGAVVFKDSIQPSDVPICVFPCLTYGALKKLNGIIFHPDYQHSFCDLEYYQNIRELGILKDVRRTNPVIFEHRHYCNGKRPADSVDQWIKDVYERDRATYDRRMRMPLAERLKI